MLAQNYRVEREVCSKCKHFLEAAEQPADWAQKLWPNNPEKWKTRTIKLGKRCGIGGFSVKDTATCDFWKPKDEPARP